MANVKSGNTHCVDATGDLTDTRTLVRSVTMTATAANAILILADTSTSVKTIELRVPTSGETKHFDFSAAPLNFPNGVKVTTATTVIATLVL